MGVALGLKHCEAGFVIGMCYNLCFPQLTSYLTIDSRIFRYVGHFFQPELCYLREQLSLSWIFNVLKGYMHRLNVCMLTRLYV